MADTKNTSTPDSEPFGESFGASPIGIAVETLEGKPLFVNPALCSMLGFSESELRNKHCADFSPPEDSQKDWVLFQRLRTGSIDNYQLEKRYFRRDGSLMWGRLSLSLLTGHASPLALAMVEDITEQKRAQDSEIGKERALRESEERLRLAQQVARIGTFEWNIRTGVNTWTPELESLYGLPPGIFGDTVTSFVGLIHPDDRAAAIGLLDAAMKTGQPTNCEWRVIWPDSSLHWIGTRCQVLMDESGKPFRMIGVSVDVTDRKLADQALAEMTRKLIEAQEKERARIGRELHDDINQRLALLSVEVEQLRANPSEIGPHLQELRTRIGEISRDVQTLAYDLHPSKLEYLGAVAGMESWSNEFALRQKLEVDFTTNVRGSLPPEIGISLFRVLQEALQNCVKHSGAKRVEVQLQQDSEAVHLVVGDQGKGFDFETASRGKGLGLTSMRERVRLLNGTISIDSKPNDGTLIQVRVPLESERVPNWGQ
jgi:PAS domain S-box-containing protein